MVFRGKLFGGTLAALKGYQNLVTIHEGARSTIFRGEAQNKDGLAVILKFIPSNDANLAERIRKEYRILTDNPCEGVPEVVALEHALGGYILVFRDIGGVSLADIIRSRQLTIDEVYFFATSSIRILIDVHSRGIIHRDIKPGNIVYNEKTHALQIIDFGLAATIAESNEGLQGSQNPLGSLHYMAPEQTGRMNQAVGQTADLYSLGVTLYECLTGHVPFIGEDAMEVVHSHIAKKAQPIKDQRTDTPTSLMDIIEKLMSKNPEDRYQSASTLLGDISMSEELYRQGRGDQIIDLASETAHRKLNKIEKIYGRNSELGSLHEELEKAVVGGFGFSVITGESGSGKSYLVNSLKLKIREKNARIVTGKFGQFRSEQPYAAVLEAFDKLVTSVLSEPELVLRTVTSRLQSELGDHGGVLVELVPSTSQLIGKTNTPEALGPVETKERLRNVMLGFLKAFCHESFPVILFIDDLQWSDFGSRAFLQEVMETTIPYLHLILAAHPEVREPAHPAYTLLTPKPGSVNVSSYLDLKPLQLHDISLLLSDLMSLPVEDVQELAQIFKGKTAGNAFFVGQLAQVLYREKILVPGENLTWDWDEDKIQRHPATENVIQILTSNLTKLTEPTRDLLMVASCFGSEFTLERLCQVLDLSKESVERDLGEAVATNFLTRYITAAEDGSKVFTFVFAHDSVQAACFNLLAEEKRQEVHFKIGSNLMLNPPLGGILKNVFLILDHLNQGRTLIQQVKNQRLLAQLNLIAAKRADRTSNFELSKKYAQMGLECLGSPDVQSSLQKHLRIALAKSQFLTDEKQEFKNSVEELIDGSKTSAAKAELCYFAASLYGVASQEHSQALKYCLRGLEALGRPIPERLGPGIFILLVQMCWRMARLGYKGISNLPARPICWEERFYAIAMAAVAQNQILVLYYSLIILKRATVNGMTRYSLVTVGTFAMVMATIFGRRKFALSLADGALAWDANQGSSGKDEFYGVANSVIMTFIKPWLEHFPKAIAGIDKSHETLRELPFVTYPTLYTALYSFCFRIWGGRVLSESLEECREKLHLLKNSKAQNMIDCTAATEVFVRTLMGESSSPTKFDAGGFDENVFEKTWARHEDVVPIGWLAILKLWNLYLYDELDNVDVFIERALVYKKTSAVGFGLTIFELIHPLILLKRARKAGRNLNLKERVTVLQSLRQLKRWRALSELNFASSYFLLKAEWSSFKGDQIGSISAYESAFKTAKVSGLIQIEAMTNESAADFYGARSNSSLEDVFKKQAARLYADWGATAKAKSLDIFLLGTRSKNGSLHGSQSLLGSQALSGTSPELKSLDIISLLKSSHAIAEELEAAPLMRKLTSIIAENAGAERGVLLIPQDGAFQVASEIRFSQNGGIYDSETNLALVDYPKNLVSYVSRTLEFLAFGNAAGDSVFQRDAYIASQKVKSVLCVPIISKSRLRAVVYLEHLTSASVFTPERVEGIKMLLGQAAISLENARLFEMAGEQARMQSELGTASLVQETLFPKPSARFGPVQIRASSQSATECGGDWWSYNEIGDRVFVWVGDVVGHGAPAALLTSAACAAVELISGFTDVTVIEALRMLNNAIYRVASRRIYMPLTVVALDKKTGVLTYALAAHIAPVILKASVLENARQTGKALRQKDLICLTQDSGTPLGSKQGSEFSSASVQLDPGDLVLLYTDGTIDVAAPDTSPLGEGNFLRTFLKAAAKDSNPEAIVESILEAFAEFRKGTPLVDDTTLVVCRYDG